MKKKAKDFMIGIPTINRSDLLNEFLSHYYIQFPKNHILIIDNGNQKINARHQNFEIHRPEKNLGVAGSWNYIMNKAYDYGYQNTLILNDDIYISHQRNIIERIITKYKYTDLIRCPKQYHMSAFILKTYAFKNTGLFDENFYPAYFEDNDYLYRINLDGGFVEICETLSPEIFNNSMTIKKDPTLNQNYEKNQEYYIKKWGGTPNREIYKTPFNNQQ